MSNLIIFIPIATIGALLVAGYLALKAPTPTDNVIIEIVYKPKVENMVIQMVDNHKLEKKEAETFITVQ